MDELGVSSPIKLEYGEAYLRPTKDEANTTEFLESRRATTPCILSFGFTSRDYLTNPLCNTGTSNEKTAANKTTWTEWPYGIWLNDFKCDNLAKVGTIPDDHIKAGFSFSAYTDTPDILPLGLSPNSQSKLPCLLLTYF